MNVWRLLGLGALGALGAFFVASSLTACSQQRAAPPLGPVVDAPGPKTGKVHYIEDGEGRPIVFLHGASGNLRDWKLSPVYEAAAKMGRAIAFDRPGHGYSSPAPGDPANPLDQARALRAELRALTEEPVILVGHSWAGSLVMAWALEWPEEVAGVMVVAGATMPWGGDLSPLYSAVATPGVGHVISWAAPAIVGAMDEDALIEQLFKPEAPPQGYAENIGVGLAAQPQSFRINARSLVALNDFLEAQSSRYGEVATPLEIVHGEADNTVWASVHSVPLAERAQDAELTLIEGGGHMIHHTRPDEVISALERLLNRAAR